MSNVEVRTEKESGVTVVYLSGAALDASNVQRFRQETGGLFESDAHFVFVLRDLKFVDSSGIGALLSCLRKANATGGGVKLAELPMNVRSLFELVRMDRLFDIYDAKEKAIDAFSV